jgi:hypothetical protein
MTRHASKQWVQQAAKLMETVLVRCCDLRELKFFEYKENWFFCTNGKLLHTAVLRD